MPGWQTPPPPPAPELLAPPLPPSPALPPAPDPAPPAPPLPLAVVLSPPVPLDAPPAPADALVLLVTLEPPPAELVELDVLELEVLELADVPLLMPLPIPPDAEKSFSSSEDEQARAVRGRAMQSRKRWCRMALLDAAAKPRVTRVPEAENALYRPASPKQTALSTDGGPSRGYFEVQPCPALQV